MSIKPGRNAFHFFFRVAVGLFSLTLIYGTAVPLLRSDAWWIRVFDFPRIQIAVLMGITLAGYAVLRSFGRLRPWDYVLAAGVCIALVWQLISIAPYTALYPKQMSDSHAEVDSNRISLLIYNVLYNNREVAALRDLIRDTGPDLILLSEPTRWWLEQLDGLEADYPYTLFQPQANHHGKLLYSRLELVDPEIRFLIEQEIPSIRTRVRLRTGTLVTLYGVHPRPPGLKRPGRMPAMNRKLTRLSKKGSLRTDKVLVNSNAAIEATFRHTVKGDYASSSKKLFRYLFGFNRLSPSSGDRDVRACSKISSSLLFNCPSAFVIIFESSASGALKGVFLPDVAVSFWD